MGNINEIQYNNNVYIKFRYAIDNNNGKNAVTG